MSRSVQAYDVGAALRELPHLDLTKGVPSADAAQNAFQMLAPFGSGGLIVGGFSGRTPWELHPDTDELLYALEGEVEVTLLTDEGERIALLRQGRACVVPKGMWHRQHARSAVKLLTISGPGPISWAEDPRDEVQHGHS